ncbi:MAG: hypothetical protein KZY61_09375 [Clostridiaceae bacterium]|nr:hypothetical protein [Clostridiaceae bacterium]MBW4858485.1 hypothetical protein [Clostridiaceae bacterium]MBW4868858.1 hypothetical protein [Clostridiaceae bacterium]
MAAIIKGIIFNDLSNNGILDSGEPGIFNAYVAIYGFNGVCVTVQTDASGVYIFSNLTVAGNYTIYKIMDR